jgi:hypothetical protein
LAVLAAPALSSCTTLATGIVSQPPGINRYSFRACLLDNGFFTPTALTDVASRDYVDRHRGDTDEAHSRADMMTVSDAAFIARTARTMRDDLMPHLQYERSPEGVAKMASALLDPSLNRPYGQNREGERYPERGFAKTTVPAVGSDAIPENSVNRYLDCYLAPVGHEAAGDEPLAGFISPNDGDYDVEGRMLRAHILLALAANYGAELLSARPSANLATRAERLLIHVRSAEEAIRAASPVMNPTLRAVLEAAGSDIATPSGDQILIKSRPGPSAQVSLRWTGTATRTLRVFQVAADIQMIDAQQSLDRAKNILAAFNQPSALLFEGVLKDALKGFGTIQKVRLFGDAMLRDSRETLAVHRRSLCPGASACQADFLYDAINFSAARPVTPKDNAWLWLHWDKQIARACVVIASAAKQENANCIPDAPALEKMTKASLPSQL